MRTRFEFDLKLTPALLGDLADYLGEDISDEAITSLETAILHVLCQKWQGQLNDLGELVVSDPRFRREILDTFLQQEELRSANTAPF